NECLTYPVDEAVVAALKAGAVCKGDDGAEVPWQLSADGQSVRFIAALPAFGKSAYTFTAGQPSVKTHLKVTETQEYFEITNALTGVRISKILNGANGATGPIAGWRLSDGAWAGGSTFTPTRKIESYTVSVVEKGAVLARVEAVALFEGGGSWKITAELIDGEPSFKVRESFDCVPEAGVFSLRFDEGFDPDWMLFRTGTEAGLRGEPRLYLGQMLSLPLSHSPEASDPSLRFYLQPWVWWAVSHVRGHFFTLMNLERGAAVTMITSDTCAWVDPSTPQAERANPSSWLKYVDDGKALTMDWQVKRGEREYALSVLPVAPIMEDVWGRPVEEIPPLPDVSRGIPDILPAWDLDFSKYGFHCRAPLSEAVALRTTHYPLNRVKDLILEWPESDGGSVRPRMLVSQEDIAAFRARITEADQGWINYGTYSEPSVYMLDFTFPAYLAKGDEALGEKLYAGIPRLVNQYVNELLKLDGGNICLGVAPHARGVLASVAYFVDLWFSLPQVTAEDRARVKGQMAFLAYVLASEEYFSPERGFAGGFLGMRTLVAMNHLALGAVLVDHPLTRHWMGMGASYLQRNVVDPWEVDGEFDGLAVQCPHYALGDYYSALAMFVMQERQGVGSILDTPRVKHAGAWYAKISTPRDPRFGYRRHLPPTGNGYLYEPAPVCGNMAYIYKEIDPAFSAEMQWMDNEQGNLLLPIGGFDPALAGARRILYDPSLPAKVPAWGSEWFKNSTVVLRSRYATEDESYLLLVAGAGSLPFNHWDREQGGVSQLWLRGVPVADDFGYNGCAPEEDHSMLTSGRAGGTMEIEDFKVTPRYDYVRGKKGTFAYDILRDTGVGVETVKGEKPAWVREIVLVKHGSAGLPTCDDIENAGQKTCATPDYFVIKDTLAEADEATWRLWLTPKVESDELEGVVTLTDGGAWMESFDGRTTHIYFPRKPANVALSIEPKTQSTPGMNAKGEYLGSRTNTRMGLILHSPKFDSLLTVVFTRREGEAEPVVALADDGMLTVGNDVIRFTDDGVTVE
ncbi:MAG: hypothetical protein FWF84_05790, partial [Kiritimatiellaeota bacterium]|nr:hypothetical protein [Kiritimatiellota bacterium]